jgi:hypothetical protein
MPFEVDLMEWPTTRPLTRWSRMVRFYWWLSFLLPPVALLAAIDTARTARVADAAMGLGYFIAPYVLAAFAVAPFLVYRAWISKAITSTERRILIALGLSVMPLFLLVAQICDDFGGWPRGQEHPFRGLTMAATVVWVGLAIAARRTLHRDIPSRWYQLYWLLMPLPLISLFLALVNVVPDKPTDDPARYPLWPFLVIVVALGAVLAYRALLSPTVTKLERIFITVSCLTVLPLVMLIFTAWQIMDHWPKDAGPARWSFLIGVVAWWIALAVATRLKLRSAEKHPPAA